MPDYVDEIGGIRVFTCASDGAALKSERDAVDLISATASANAEWTLLSIARP
ncbi:MAG TPA: hypothetical protein VKR52_16730 [Terracidiphilus sp.]|nr:hypothetical protein [Terracidiphilus sp.]